MQCLESFCELVHFSKIVSAADYYVVLIIAVQHFSQNSCHHQLCCSCCGGLWLAEYGVRVTDNRIFFWYWLTWVILDKGSLKGLLRCWHYAGCKDGKFWWVFQSKSTFCPWPITTDSVSGNQWRYIVIIGKRYFLLHCGLSSNVDLNVGAQWKKLKEELLSVEMNCRQRVMWSMFCCEWIV